MRRVMAQGTFDVVHPGHLHYFRESAALGDELYVVIARDSRMRDRKDLFMDENSRRAVVEALDMVDAAVLGSEGSIFQSVSRVDPDVITLGYDQEFDIERLEAELADAGFPTVEVTRISQYDGPGVASSSAVKAQLRRRFGDAAFYSVADKE